MIGACRAIRSSGGSDGRAAARLPAHAPNPHRPQDIVRCLHCVDLHHTLLANLLISLKRRTCSQSEIPLHDLMRRPSSCLPLAERVCKVATGADY